MMKTLIITGGRIDEDFALSFLEKESFHQIIVVDGALAFWDKMAAHHLGLRLDHLVGDFDTIDSNILQKYIHREDIEVHRFNPVKDYTDTDIALKIAIALSKERDEQAEITLLGATGTRLDHTLANLQMLEQTRAAGVDGVIIDKNNKIRLIEGHMTIHKNEQFGDFISLIPITPMLKSVTLSGFKYNLEQHDVSMGESLCVSNELYAEIGEISIGEGKALLIESRD